MTTLVAVETPGGVTFASDSRASGRNLNDGWVTKVFQNGGMTIGVAGLLGMSQKIRYMELPELPKSNKPDKIDKWVTQVLAPVFVKADVEYSNGDRENLGRTVILLEVHGRVYEISTTGSWTRNGSGVYSVGSGSSYALGALEAGATPKKAIKIASKYDWGTNSDVRVLKVASSA